MGDLYFKMRYPIKQIFLSQPSKRRSGIKANKIRFLVAHDTGNEGSTARANVMYYERSKNDMSASAHLFVDNNEIIECIPAFQNAEKAWHVVYNVDSDNQRYGYDANDSAIGVELCYGGAVNNYEAYKKYVWTLAYLCHVYNLDPKLDIVGHCELDPKRKTDPLNSLRTIHKTLEDLIDDVAFELEVCRMEDSKEMQEIIARIEKLEKLHQLTVPDWAEDAVESAYKKGIINNKDTGSLDYFRLLTILHRAKVI